MVTDLEFPGEIGKRSLGSRCTGSGVRPSRTSDEPEVWGAYCGARICGGTRVSPSVSCRTPTTVSSPSHMTEDNRKIQELCEIPRTKFQFLLHTLISLRGVPGLTSRADPAFSSTSVL